MAHVAHGKRPWGQYLVLRQVAAFLNRVTDEMEKQGNAFDHEHLRDFHNTLADRPALIIARESSG